MVQSCVYIWKTLEMGTTHCLCVLVNAFDHLAHPEFIPGEEYTGCYNSAKNWAQCLVYRLGTPIHHGAIRLGLKGSRWAHFFLQYKMIWLSYTRTSRGINCILCLTYTSGLCAHRRNPQSHLFYQIPGTCDNPQQQSARHLQFNAKTAAFSLISVPQLC